MATIVDTDALLPEIEDTLFDPRDIYLIMYKRGGTVETRYFHFVSPIENDPNPNKSAVARAMLFCTRMDLRFFHCTPFLIDLDQLERKRAEY